MRERLKHGQGHYKTKQKIHNRWTGGGTYIRNRANVILAQPVTKFSIKQTDDNICITFCPTSAQRLRRWSNIVQMLYMYKCFVLRGFVKLEKIPKSEKTRKWVGWWVKPQLGLLFFLEMLCFFFVLFSYFQKFPFCLCSAV